MKLATLLEYQRCYRLLREADRNHKQLTGPDYLAAVKAEGAFERELAQIIDPQEVEVTA